MSKIPVHTSLVVARKVIRELEKIIPKAITKDCRIESWSNCREQGLCLISYHGCEVSFCKKFCISEARNSDSILVINGTNYDFDIQTNQPSEELWGSDNRKYFRYKDFKGAAEHILKILS